MGGFSLGLDRTGGFKTAAFCEIEEFPRKVLKKHWPEVPCYDDVCELTGERVLQDVGTIDVITGGFPCQDISTAGLQAGIDGEKSGLWSELARLIGDIRPKYAIVENVAELLRGPYDQRGAWFGRVLGDLAEIGYDAEWHVISASTLGAPHVRPRVWIVAYPNGTRLLRLTSTALKAGRGVRNNWIDFMSIVFKWQYPPVHMGEYMMGFPKGYTDLKE